MTLTAATSPAISEGVATFKVLDGNGNQVGNTVQGNVSGAHASASFTVPTGLAVGAYTIAVSYSDATGSYVDNGDTYGTLTISTAPVTTTAGNVGVHFSSSGQAVTLTAAVSPAITGGIATFTVFDGNGHQVGNAVQGTVSNGSASASFTVPSGLVVGTYTIKVSYSDAGGPFVDGGDTNGTLTISGTASVTIAAGNVATPFSKSTQTVTLTAAVSPAVSEGTVTFTVLKHRNDGSYVPVGNAVQGTVSNGSASASFTVSSGLAVGVYTIKVSYSDASGSFVDGGDTSGTLTIAPVTTTAGNVTTPFSKSTQTVTLTAAVNPAISEGTVTFTVLKHLNDGSYVPVGNAVQGTVSNGSASANFTVPKGLAVGVYTIKVSYSDASGSFVDGGDTSGTLTIAPVTTTAGNVTTPFSKSTQTVTLTAAVNPAISEGTVTFTVLKHLNDGSYVPVGNAVQGTVSNGSASASFTVPSGLAVGTYTIKVSYSDAGGSFVDGGDTSGTLTIAPVTTTASNVSANFSSSDQSVTLTAAVSPAVSEGTVTFTVLKHLNDGSYVPVGNAVQGTVSNGSASANFTVPKGLAVGTYTIKVSYHDAGGSFVDGGDTNGTLTIQAKQ